MFKKEWGLFQGALQKLVACIHPGEGELAMDALPEVTSLLNTFFDLFQEKADQVSSLKSQLRELNTKRAAEYEQLVGEIE